jgi:hypothetical protein
MAATSGSKRLDEQGWRSEQDRRDERDPPGRRDPAEADVTTELLGDELGHHELVRVVGSGPRGLVYEAFDPRLGRRVAIKTFRLDAWPAQAADDFEARLRSGTVAAAALQHPNIVAVHGCDRHGPTASLAMEFVEGENLGQHLARVGKLPALQALALVAQLLSALEAAHANGVVHGRIEPEHLLVSRTGRLKVAGFGVPQPAGADVRTDLFSAAVIAYHLLTGSLPLPRPEAAGAAAAPRALRPDLPPAVDGVFARALAKDPEDRYRSAGEFFAALRAAFDPPLWERPDRASGAAPADVEPDTAVVVAHSTPVARKPPPTGSHRNRRGKRHRFAVAVASALGVLTVAALLLAGESGPPTPAAAAKPVALAAEPTGSLAVGPAPVVAPAPAPIAAVTMAEPPAPNITTLQTRPLETAPPIAPVQMAPPEVVAVRREPDPVPPARSGSNRRADDTRVAGAGPMRAVVARRQAPPANRQGQRGHPEAACRHQQLTLAREVCKVAQCASVEWSSHPVCVRMHAEQRWRDQVAEQAARTR